MKRNKKLQKLATNLKVNGQNQKRRFLKKFPKSIKKKPKKRKTKKSIKRKETNKKGF